MTYARRKQNTNTNEAYFRNDFIAPMADRLIYSQRISAYLPGGGPGGRPVGGPGGRKGGAGGGPRGGGPGMGGAWI